MRGTRDILDNTTTRWTMATSSSVTNPTRASAHVQHVPRAGHACYATTKLDSDHDSSFERMAGISHRLHHASRHLGRHHLREGGAPGRTGRQHGHRDHMMVIAGPKTLQSARVEGTAEAAPTVARLAISTSRQEAEEPRRPPPGLEPDHDGRDAPIVRRGRGRGSRRSTSGSAGL